MMSSASNTISNIPKPLVGWLKHTRQGADSYDSDFYKSEECVQFLNGSDFYDLYNTKNDIDNLMISPERQSLAELFIDSDNLDDSDEINTAITDNIFCDVYTFHYDDKIISFDAKSNHIHANRLFKAIVDTVFNNQMIIKIPHINYSPELEISTQSCPLFSAEDKLSFYQFCMEYTIGGKKLLVKNQTAEYKPYPGINLKTCDQLLKMTKNEKSMIENHCMVIWLEVFEEYKKQTINGSGIIDRLYSINQFKHYIYSLPVYVALETSYNRLKITQAALFEFIKKKKEMYL
jgi:hypothetical protein